MDSSKPLNYQDYKSRFRRSDYTSPHSILLDRVEKIENIALILRTAESVGIKKLFLYQPQCAIQEARLKRFSRSASTRVKIKIIEFSDVEFLQAEYHFLAIELTDDSEVIFISELQNTPCMLIGGSESEGISSEILNLCDQSVHLPIWGPQSSINLACAMSSAIHFVAWQSMSK